MLHATTVAREGAAVVFLGASGQGKSTLALQLMAYGCDLVADDRSCFWRDGDLLWVDSPQTIRGQIEARQVGILRAEATGPRQVALFIDLDQQESERLPPIRQHSLLGLDRPLLHNVQAQHFAPAILQYLKAGRQA